MAGVNKVIIVGNLGRDPEVRHTPSGVQVCSFPVATSESYTDRNTNERREITEWHNIVVWRRLAEIAEKYLKKGSQVYIEGKIRTRSWEDESGQKRYATEIVGDIMQLLGRAADNPGYQGNSGNSAKTAAGSASNQQQQTPTPTPAAATQEAGSDNDSNDDLPF